LCTDQGIAVKFKVLMALTMKTAILWDATPRTLVQRYQEFEKNCAEEQAKNRKYTLCTRATFIHF